MKVLVIGREGQVARALDEMSDSDFKITCVGRPQVDLIESASIKRAIADVRPEIVVNTAAYTAVDKAESEPEVAFALNRDGARNVATAAAAVGLPVIHLSTDYVFPGNKSAPYMETDVTGPGNVYGRSKLAGEQAVTKAAPQSVILRTSWLYAPWGQNFARTMLRLAETRDVIRVVDDQTGAPNFAPDIARAIVAVCRNIRRKPEDLSRSGIFHLTSKGFTTWAGFAEAIFAASAANGGPTALVEKIPTSQYPTPARRPANSRLDTSKFESTFQHRLPTWQEGLKRFIQSLDRATTG